MPEHAQERQVPFTPAEMYALVADIESYPAFLPWCAGARIRSREAGEGDTEIVMADLIIAYKMFRGTYTSRVTLDRNNMRIDVAHARGPFRRLKNQWRFEDAGEGGCRISFYIDFEFSSKIIQKMMDAVFMEAMQRIIQAFEERAVSLYGARDSRAAQANTA